MDKKSMINYEKRPVPSSPGPHQITTNGQDYQKGGADFKQPTPSENMIPMAGKTWDNDSLTGSGNRGRGANK